MREADFDRRVRELIAEMLLYVHHTPDSRRSAAGWPDLVIVGRRVLYRELKSARGVLSGEQVRMRDRLLWARADWAVWRPRDLYSGRIESELIAIT